MSIRITVFQTQVRELKGVSEKSGSPKPYHMRFQYAYAHTVDQEGNTPPVPEKFEISLDRDQMPYSPGDYTLQPSAIYVDRNGRLSCYPRLTPVKTPPATATR